MESAEFQISHFGFGKVRESRGSRPFGGSRAEPRPIKIEGVQRINPLVRVWAGMRPSYRKRGRAKRAIFPKPRTFRTIADFRFRISHFKESCLDLDSAGGGVGEDKASAETERSAGGG
jgi:hypothetical protein